MKKHTAVIGLGTNLDNKQLNLLNALRYIAQKIGHLSAISSIHETAPWGFESSNMFLNMVVKVETKLEVLELLRETQAIEKEMGRTGKTTDSYHDRIIDLDIILYDDLKYQSDELTLPHPHYKKRDFVMLPLQEII